MDNAVRPYKNEQVRWVSVNGRTVLLGRRGRYCSLNSSAAFVWDLCDRTRTADDITRLLSRRYHIGSAAIVRRDVGRILEDLFARGVIDAEKRRHTHVP